MPRIQYDDSDAESNFQKFKRLATSALDTRNVADEYAQNKGPFGPSQTDKEKAIADQADTENNGISRKARAGQGYGI